MFTTDRTYMMALPASDIREIVWIEKKDFRGWACSQCKWKFNPAGIPAGIPARNTLAEIKQNYERHRDAEFESHVCAKHPCQPSKAGGRRWNRDRPDDILTTIRPTAVPVRSRTP